MSAIPSSSFAFWSILLHLLFFTHACRSLAPEAASLPFCCCSFMASNQFSLCGFAGVWICQSGGSYWKEKVNLQIWWSSWFMSRITILFPMLSSLIALPVPMSQSNITSGWKKAYILLLPTRRLTLGLLTRWWQFQDKPICVIISLWISNLEFASIELQSFLWLPT